MRNMRVHIQSIKGRQIFFINEFQFFFHVHISIKVNIAVGRMVIGSVEVKEFFVGKLRNILRVTTGFYSIGVIREKAVHNFPLQNFIRGRKSTFHFIVYYSIVSQWAFFILKVVAPAFLTENLLFLINIRIKYSIQIYMHQILEILIITACNWITGLVRISHCIQECVQRALYQLYKWILQRELAGATQNAVFQDVWYTCAVPGRCAKCNGKYFILVIVLNKNKSCACFFVAYQISGRMNICQIFLFLNFICRNVFYSHFFLQKSCAKKMLQDVFY